MSVARVVLDPGHGSETAGKCSPDRSYLEHEFNLDVAQRLKGILEHHGVEVTMTRSDRKDVSLERRVQIANQISNLDLFVSLHSNASGREWTSPRGFGIYTSASGEGAGRNRAARAILKRALEEGISLWGSGLFHNIGLYVLKYTTAPAILIEHGFHSNKEDVSLLKTDSYRERLARVDAKGILDYLGIPWQEGDPWYSEAQNWVISMGISDGSRPEEFCTRSELWEMLYKAITE